MLRGDDDDDDDDDDGDDDDNDVDISFASFFSLVLPYFASVHVSGQLLSDGFACCRASRASWGERSEPWGDLGRVRECVRA